MIAGPVRAAAGADGSALDLLGQAGVVAVRLADLSSPGGRGRGKDGRTALAVAGAGRITAGDLVLPSGLATLEGRVKGTTRRAMTPALAIRFTLLMTLMPDADYPAVLETLLGDLILVPWQRPYRLPTAAVACTWRAAIGAPRI
ncbi:MAG TPA: hypothetical protein VGU21_09745, partial [Streptosporangiaceae bacterium]|nr:hypothetical protein [Streptosporangiaceae bacterium]